MVDCRARVNKDELLEMYKYSQELDFEEFCKEAGYTKQEIKKHLEGDILTGTKAILYEW